MPHPKEITPEALQEMEERLDQYFADLDRPNRLEEIKNKLAKGQSLTNTDGVFALLHYRESFDCDFLRQILHPEVKFISKHVRLEGIDEVVEQFAQWYKPEKEQDKYASPRQEFINAVLPRFVDGRLIRPALTRLGKFSSDHGCQGFMGISLQPLDRDMKESPDRISGFFATHYFDHLSGRIAFGDVECIPSKRLLDKATGFQVAMKPTGPNKIALVVSTLTQLFEVELCRQERHILDINPLDGFGRWLKAIDTGVDSCTLRLQQRCTVYLHAIAMNRGLVKLLIHSARDEELFDLSAVMVKEDLIRHFQDAMDSLPADSESTGEESSVTA
jgi:hypothetical protein